MRACIYSLLRPRNFFFLFRVLQDTLHISLKMTKLHMRAATLADIPRLAEIWAIAFLDDAFYNTIFPRRSEFMADYRAMWARKLKKRFLGLGEWYIVVEAEVVDASGQSRMEIAGWASWKRMGSSKAAEKIAADNECFLKGVCEVGWVGCLLGEKEGLCRADIIQELNGSFST